MLKAMAAAPRDGTVIIIFHHDFSAGYLVAWTEWDDGSASWANIIDGAEVGSDKEYAGWIRCPADIVSYASRAQAGRELKQKS